METNQQQTQTQLSETAENTFSAQLAQENNGVAESSFDNNATVLAQHRRSKMYTALWIALALLLLASIGFVLWLIFRSPNSPSKTSSAADNFNTTNLSLTGDNQSAQLNGQLTVNGNELVAGNLTVLGQADVVGNANVGSDLSVGGTVTASNLVGNLDATNISGIIQPAQLDPFIAYTNKNFQAFMGTNQIFRNSSNSVGAFEVQNASSAPILSVNTATSTVTVNESTASQSGLAFEVNGNGRFAGSLQVGALSNPNTSILNTGPLFSDDVQRVLTIQNVVTDNSVADRIFAGTSAELLANPQTPPVTLGTSLFGLDIVTGGNKNIFTGGYSALQTEQTNTQDFYLNGGNLSSSSHAGSGIVFIANGQFSVVSNLGVGDIAYSIGSAAVPTTQNGPDPNGLIKYWSGFTAIDPTDPVLGFLGLVPLAEPNTIDHQVGIQIMHQDSAIGGKSANIVSEGYTSRNFFEGKIFLGTCANNLTPSSSLGTGFCFTPPPSGNKLYINPNLSFFDDTNATVIVHAADPTDKPIVVVGEAAQTASLMEWQRGGGLVNTVLSRVTSDGNFGIRNAAPAAGIALHVGSAAIASGTTVARFENAGGTCDVTPNVVGAVSCTSDIRAKKNIFEITDTLEKLGAIKVYNYNLKAENDGDPIHVGFLAQELEEILPDLVITDKNGMKSVSYAGLTPYLVQAIKQQQAQINSLKAKNLEPTTVTVDVLKTLSEAEAVKFGGDVTILGNTFVKSHIVGNSDTRGTVTVGAGQSQASESFSKSYGSSPNVVVSPSSGFAPKYRVVSTPTSFSIILEEPALSSVTFNYQVQQ